MPNASSQPAWKKRVFRAFALGCAILPTYAAEDSAELLGAMEPGSVIEDLLVPQYNKQRLATVVLRVDRVTVITNSLIRVENTSLHLIRNESAQRMGPTMLRIADATYDLNNGMLESTSPVRATSARFDMQGSGIVSRLQRGKTQHQMFLRPPVLGYIHAKETPIVPAMHTPRPLAAALLAAFSVQAQDTKPPAPDISLLTMSPRNEAAEKALLDFAKEHKIPLNAVTPPPLPAAALAPVDPAQEPPQFKPGPDAIGFSCKGGVFYNSETSTLTFLEQTTVRDPLYAMTVNGKVLVTFSPKKPKAKNDENPGTPKNDEKSQSLGDVSTIVGSGGATFEVTDKESVKNFAFGDNVTYDATKKTVILRGNRLILQKGNIQRFESANANAWLNYDLEKKEFQMSEGWNAKIVIPEEDKKKPR